MSRQSRCTVKKVAEMIPYDEAHAAREEADAVNIARIIKTAVGGNVRRTARIEKEEIICAS